MASLLAWLPTLLIIGCAVSAKSEPISVSAARQASIRHDSDGWRPVRDSGKHKLRLPPPSSAYYVELGHKKYYHADSLPSNKVEVFAPAPPSILGTFSGFGHETIKTRHPVKHSKKPYKETFQQAESRPGYQSEFLPQPYRHYTPQPFKQNDNVGQAYFFEASLSPPPRDSAISFVPPPSSKLAPNSYYLQFDQQTRAKPTSPTFSPYLRQSLPIYSNSEYFKPTNPTSDPYRFYSPDPPSKAQYNSRPTNSHGRPPGLDYFGSNPFGDIHLNTNRPETKTPAKDVFEQLSPLGRPFQSSTISPPRLSSPSQPNEFSSFPPLEYYSTSGNLARQTTPKPFRPSPLIIDTFPSTERPGLFVTPGPAPPAREVYPIPVTTLDIPARDEFFNRPSSAFVNTYQTFPETQQYQEEVTTKPTATTLFKKKPEVEVNTNVNSFYQPTPFLPTPTTDLDQFVEQNPTELITPSSEINEVHKPTRPQVSRPRYRKKKKPARKPQTQYIVETTSEHSFETPANEYSVNNDERPNLTTFDTPQNTYQSIPEREQESEPQYIRNEERYKKRRRPSRPTNLHSTTTFANNDPDNQDNPTDSRNLPEEDVKTTPFSSSTTAFNKLQNQRRRNKPVNRIRGSMRHGLSRSTTSTTTEPPQEFTSDIIAQTDFQTVKETNPTENYPITGVAFNEYGHVVHTGTDDYSINTLYPTQQIDEYQTSFQEAITTSTTTTPEPTTTPTTTTTTTTTQAPETTSLSTTKPRPRIRNKYNYNNHNRPRFSVKDYKDRINKSTTTTEAPKEETDEQKDIPRIKPTRQRGTASYKQTENQDEQVETTTRRFRPRYTAQRHAYRTSTTQSPLLQLDTPTTTERQNTFRPSSLRRPGSNKYYSRYRTSTEAPESPEEQPASDKLPQRPKGVFSAKKRRPFPLRTRVEAVTKENEDVVDTQSEDINDLDHDQYITRKSDNVATTTLMTSSEEANWNTPSSARPEVYTLDSVDQGDITKKIADLTSSPSNSFDSSGFFKGVSQTSSRRTVSQITLATEDPILPIEAFFSSSINKNSESR